MKKLHLTIMALAVFAAMQILSGCGGGGGGGTTTAVAPETTGGTPQGGVTQTGIAGSTGSGKIAAVVKLTGKVGGRFVAQSTSSTVNVKITVSGIYAGDGKEFEPVSTVYPVNLAQGYARVTLLEVPVGVNHILTAEADWGGGSVETVMAIIPAVTTGQATTVTADQASTVVTQTVVHYSSEHGTAMPDVTQEFIDSVAEAVAGLAATTAYSAMTPSSVLTFMSNAGIPFAVSISPASATVVLGQTLKFSASVLDANGTAISGATTSWSFSPTTYASVDSSGLLAALLAGTGYLTATYQQLSAMAAVTVAGSCNADIDCNDGVALTLDACSNPGTSSSTCTHTTVQCVSASDCNDNIALTIDACDNGGTASAACTHTQIACNESLDCDDANALTLDVCTSGGTTSAACSNTAIACNVDIDCDDTNATTVDICTNGGTTSAVCSHPVAVCTVDTDCDDGNALTTDTCLNPGTLTAACSSTLRRTVASGGEHTCQLQPGGTVKCWGANYFGQLGMGQMPQQMYGKKAGRGAAPTAATHRSGGNKRHARQTSGGRSTARSANLLAQDEFVFFAAPVDVVGLTGAVQVSSGQDFSCAVLGDGTVQCWGYGVSGQLGDGLSMTSATPVTVSGISNAIAVSAGSYHACALLDDGSIMCWGDNYSGELGDGNSATSSSTPVQVAGLGAAAVQVSAGSSYTCALLADTTVMCWGINYTGNLGDGTMTDSITPVAVSNLTGAKLISTGAGGEGGMSVCALMDDGTVQCWGSNYYGQLGNSTTVDSSVPVTVSSLSGVVDVSVGSDSACAVLASGAAYCWGDNMFWKLGNSEVLQTGDPQLVTALSGSFNSVSAGLYHTCFGDAVSATCIGDYYYGQLGDGRAYVNYTPASEFGLTGIVGKPSIGDYHACAVMSDGTLRCWGYNYDGQLGADPANANLQLYPVTVPGISNAVKTVAGYYHSCALLADSTAECWGYNYNGQLGDGTNIDSYSPVPVTDGLGGTLTGIADIAAGGETTCAMMTDGTVKCWGYGGDGELGDGNGTNSNIPVNVYNMGGATSITVGESHVCAIADQPGGMARIAGRTANLIGIKTVQCWGYGYDGELGTGSSMNEMTPADTGMEAAVVEAGGNHTCAIMLDSSVMCWGDNYNGQLGIGTTGTSELYPVPVSGLTGAVDIAANYGTTCVVLGDNSVQCWGSNNNYLLGDGTGTDSAVPITVPSLSGISTVSSGSAHNCAVTTGGQLLCWGHDLFMYGY